MKKLACLVLFLTTAAFADDVTTEDHLPADEPCSLATLSGMYLFAQEGFSVTGPDAGSRQPVAQAGWESYDGRGHARGVYTYSDNGEISRGTYTAVYTMEPDCTGTLVTTEPDGTVSNYDIFAVPGGDEFVWIQTDEGTVNAGWEQRRTRARHTPWYR